MVMVYVYCLLCFSYYSTIKVWDLKAALDPRTPASGLCQRTLVVSNKQSSLALTGYFVCVCICAYECVCERVYIHTYVYVHMYVTTFPYYLV